MLKGGGEVGKVAVKGRGGGAGALGDCYRDLDLGEVFTVSCCSSAYYRLLCGLVDRWGRLLGV